VGEEERKLPTIVSSVITELDKFDEVCRFIDCKVVFSDSVLNALPINYKFVYRHIGSLGINNKTLLFEDLEVLPRDVCSAVIKAKPLFEKGVLCYQKGDYKEACNLFGEALKLAPEDKSCYVYYNKAMEKLD